MLDIRRLRHEPDSVRAALGKRSPDLPPLVDRILTLDEERRESIGRVNDLKAQRNEASRKIGEIKRAGGDAESLVVEMREVGDSRWRALDSSVKVRATLLCINQGIK